MTGVHGKERLSSRERVLAALSVEEPDRVPFVLSFYPTLLPQTLGKDADAELGTDVRFVEFNPPRQHDEFLEYLELLKSDLSWRLENPTHIFRVGTPSGKNNTLSHCEMHAQSMRYRRFASLLSPRCIDIDF